jgi:hypothetical protein
MTWAKRIAFGVLLISSALLLYHAKAQTQVSLTPSPSSLVFTAPIGKTSTPQTFTITNTTSIAQTITSVKVASGVDWYKVVGGTCSVNLVLAAGQTCTVQVTFSMPAAPPTNFQLKTAQGGTNVPQTGDTHFAAGGR